MQTWLTSPIPQWPLQNTRVEVNRGQGTVLLRTWSLAAATPQETPIAAYPVELEPWRQDLRTGPDGKATIVFLVDGKIWGRIDLDANSILRLGFVSPQLTEAQMVAGKARFRTESATWGGHFSVDLVGRTGEIGG